MGIEILYRGYKYFLLIIIISVIIIIINVPGERYPHRRPRHETILY